MAILEQIYIVLEANKKADLPNKLTNKLYRLTVDYKKGVDEFLKDDQTIGKQFKDQILPNFENWVKRLPKIPKYK